MYKPHNPKQVPYKPQSRKQVDSFLARLSARFTEKVASLSNDSDRVKPLLPEFSTMLFSVLH